jgi:hypothetical protein
MRSAAPGRAIALATLLGCAPSAAPPPVAAPAADTRFTPVEREPYTPPPRRRGSTGRAQALIVGSGEAQARATAMAFVAALLDGDHGSVHGLLAPRVVHAVDGRQVTRADEVERCMGGADVLSYEPDLVVDDVIDVRAVEVERAGDYHAEMPIPVGIEPSDLVVTLPARRGSATHQRIPCLARIYVRTGSKPQIVALTR